MAKDRNYIQGGRVLVRFNTSTQKHKSLKDYTRKLKHRKKIEDEE
jgi:hypothetical protein